MVSDISDDEGSSATLRIGIFGTGTLATALGTAWTRSGHEVVVAGRSREKAETLARRLGSSARASTPRGVIVNSAVVLLAVLWPGVESVLRQAGADEGALDGKPLIDPTNAVEHGVGVLLTPAGVSAAEHIAELAPGARVVKAFNMFPADQWVATQRATDAPVLVPMCGDDFEALELVSGLVRDVGARPAVLGSLPRARQLEEAAGFVIGLAFAGNDPSAAIPRIPVPSEAKAGK